MESRAYENLDFANLPSTIDIGECESDSIGYCQLCSRLLSDHSEDTSDCAGESISDSDNEPKTALLVNGAFERSVISRELIGGAFGRNHNWRPEILKVLAASCFHLFSKMRPNLQPEFDLEASYIQLCSGAHQARPGIEQYSASAFQLKISYLLLWGM